MVNRLLLLLGATAACGPAFTQDPATSGTQQLAGLDGKFGATYTILFNGQSKVNFTVVSAAYSIDPINVNAGNMDTVDATHKFLIVHYRVKNPTAGDLYMGAGNLFQAVDGQGHTYTDLGNCRRESEKHTLDLTLKAGQGADDLFTYIVVPGDQPIPKLILTEPVADTSKKVIRFDLHQPANAVKSLTAPYVDPADKTGAVALSVIPAAVGTTYVAGYAGMTVASIGLMPGPFGDVQAEDGKQFLVVTVKLTNPGWLQRYFAGTSLKFAVATDDDKITDCDLAKAAHDEAFRDATLDSGESQTLRMLIKVPKDAKLKSLTLSVDMADAGISRAFVYDLSAVK